MLNYPIRFLLIIIGINSRHNIFRVVTWSVPGDPIVRLSVRITRNPDKVHYGSKEECRSRMEKNKTKGVNKKDGIYWTECRCSDGLHYP